MKITKSEMFRVSYHGVWCMESKDANLAQALDNYYQNPSNIYNICTIKTRKVCGPNLSNHQCSLSPSSNKKILLRTSTWAAHRVLSITVSLFQ